jgi:hypothetical protein
MLDGMPNKYAVPEVLLDVGTDVVQGRGSLQPGRTDAVNGVQTVSDLDFWVYKGVQQDATFLVYESHLADILLAVALFHLTVNSYEQGSNKLSLWKFLTLSLVPDWQA